MPWGCLPKIPSVIFDKGRKQNEGLSNCSKKHIYEEKEQAHKEDAIATQ